MASWENHQMLFLHIYFSFGCSQLEKIKRKKPAVTIRHVKSQSLHEWACYFVKTVKYTMYSTICATVCTQWLPSRGTLPSGLCFRWGDQQSLCMHACACKIGCLQLLLLMSAEELCWHNLIAISKSLYCKLNALHCKTSPSLLLLPAVDDNRSGVWNGTLGAVDFLQEPEDTPRFIRHAVVWPTQVLVVPDVPQRLLLQKKPKKKPQQQHKELNSPKCPLLSFNLNM